MSESAPSHDDGFATHDQSPKGAVSQKDSSGVVGMVKETLWLIVTALLLATLIKMFLIQTFYIPTESMLETLQVNDRVMVEKISYMAGDPERGDIIVFRRPGLEPDGLNPVAALRGLGESVGLIQPEAERDLIKRIIALPGEQVEVVEGVTYINGKALPESYIVNDYGNFGPFTVPPGEYFMMGDNRGNSLDSRFSLGTVPRENIIGKAFTIIWPAAHTRWGLSANHEYGELAESQQTTADVSSGS